MALVCDLETNGLLDELNRVHCLSIGDTETGEITAYADQPGHRPIVEGLERLTAADRIYAHNGIGFDRPALLKVYPNLRLPEFCDTLVRARVVWPEITSKDLENPKMPRNLAGSHSLKAWGYRLGEHKGEYSGGWERFSEEMLEYCVQDVQVALVLLKKIAEQRWPEASFALEEAFARAIHLQERRGIGFDLRAAHELYASLCGRRSEIEDELSEAFPPWVVAGETKTAKRNMTLTLTDADGVRAKRKIASGDEYTNHEVVVFNPGSRAHIANRLMALWGWQPTEYGNNGVPSVDENILAGLPYPEAKLLTEYLTLQKRIGALAEGNQAWMKLESNGRIYGRVNTNGALTGRCTHSRPNLAQVPAEAAYRSLFVPATGYVMVGVDAKGLELRCLAHYVALWDGGKYAEVVSGGDPHSFMASAIGLPRQKAKVFTYAFLYGAGNKKLGSIVRPTASEREQAKLGAELRERVNTNFEGLGTLLSAIERKIKNQGFIVGLDGRRLVPRTRNSALNTLLQSAGAVLMKQALVLLMERLAAEGFRHGQEFALVANVHDEIQAEVLPEHVETFKQMSVQAIRDAGPALGFRCPLDGDAKHGATWADTH